MRLKIKTKILLTFVFLVVTSSIINIGIASFAVQKNLTTDLVNRIIVNTKAQISDLTNFILIGDKEGVFNLIYNQKASHKDLAYLVVIDKESRLIASTLINETPDDIIKYSFLPEGENEQVALIRRENGEQVYNITLRLDYHSGFLIAGYFKNQIDQSVVSVVYLLALGAILAIIIALLLALFFTRTLFKPLNNLKEAVQKITDGDLTISASVTTSDEIGELASAFNIMSSKLRESYSGLEEKVKERTRKLAEEEDKLQFLVRALPVGVIVIRASDGRATLMNERGTMLLGQGINLKADLSNAGEIYKFIKEDGSPYPSDDLPQNVALKTGLPAESHDIYIKHPDNTLIALKMVASPLKGPDGTVISTVVVFDDITKEQEIDKAKTEFVSLASHQLRTPLSTINWYTEMLMAGDAGPINENQKKFLSEIYLGSTRMVDLVNALLNVSRLELGTFVIEPEPTDMVALVRSVMDEQKPQLDERKQKLIPKLDKTLPIMHVDPKLMRMVVQNLLSNAIKYTPEEGTIELALSFDDAKKNMILKVSDNGYGITKSQQSQIFMKLFRADNVKAKDTVGTGLGLYIVKSIVEHSDGTIWFESEEDKGTTFLVSLPLSGMKKKKGEKSLS